jgi:hypothetical protein
MEQNRKLTVREACVWEALKVNEGWIKPASGWRKIKRGPCSPTPTPYYHVDNSLFVKGPFTHAIMSGF